MADKIISPSLLAADLTKLGEEVNHVISAGADWIHLDVMDNHFVPNLTFGPMFVRALKEHGVEAPMDVHLMVEPVADTIEAFAESGADIITIHAEADKHIDRQLNLIRDLGCLAGLAFNPATPIDCLEYLLVQVDLVLIMSVNPGFGGQQFIPSILKKIKKTRELISKAPQEVRLSVDGGITVDNINAASRAGADTFVAGTAIFSSDNYHDTIDALRSEIKKL